MPSKDKMIGDFKETKDDVSNKLKDDLAEEDTKRDKETKKKPIEEKKEKETPKIKKEKKLP